MIGRRAAIVAAAALLPAALLATGAPDTRRSGFADLRPETQAMQRDDTANPGMLSVLDGALLWQQPAGSTRRACAGCHGDIASMKGVAVRYPAYDEQVARPLSLEQRVQACRTRHQKAPAWRPEHKDLLAITAALAHQSRGLPIEPPADPRLAPFVERGRQRYEQRIGQLDFSCRDCHDTLAGRRLGGSLIPQAHPTGYPIYRLEWQSMGSLQRRLRNCMNGVRAELFAFDAPEYAELELFLMTRARGMPLETPAVRP